MFHLLLFFVHYLPAYDDPAVYRLVYANHVATMPRSEVRRGHAACCVSRVSYTDALKGSR